jgi:uncharacterized protein with PIN domain
MTTRKDPLMTTTSPQPSPIPTCPECGGRRTSTHQADAITSGRTWWECLRCGHLYWTAQ